PDVAGGAGGVEKDQVGGDVGIGGKDAFAQAHDGVQVELLQQVGLDARADAVAEQCAVRHNHGGAATPGAFKPPHDQLQEQQRGFGGAPVLGEIVQNPR